MHRNVRAVVDAAAERGLTIEPRSYPDGTRTAQDAADAIGVDLEIQDSNFDGLISDMNAGKVDIVVAGLSPDPERECERQGYQPDRYPSHQVRR